MRILTKIVYGVLYACTFIGLTIMNAAVFDYFNKSYSELLDKE